MTVLAALPALSATASGAAQAYARVLGGGDDGGGSGDAAGGFGAALGRALEGVVQAGRAADAQSVKALSGAGDLTQVATAVSRAELALQGATAIRDKVVAAYQDVMRMPI